MERSMVAQGELAVYRWLVLARVLDRALCAANPRWFPVEGEEATVVGAFCDLRPDDVAAPHYRDPFVVYLMRGAELWRLAAQALGKAAGYNRGRSVPFTGPFERRIVPWVAGDLGTTVGVAAGAALALRQAGSDAVCVCTFGDGTANRGDVHEALNAAACLRLPIVYVCQNNGWSISQPLASYLPAPVVDRAAGYGIPGAAVDGNDVAAVREVVGAAVARARGGAGPSLIEARTWRARGHWAGDAATYRAAEAPAGWRDPLAVQADRLARLGVGSAQLDDVRREAEAAVAAALERARALPDAGPNDLGLDEIYAAESPDGVVAGAPGQVDLAIVPPRQSLAEGAPGRQPGARRLTNTEAIVEAIAEAMRSDGRVFCLGQDIGQLGGAMQGTQGLFEEFGPDRIIETPISESAMVGLAIGAALFGRRPIVEISFGEFLPAAMNQLINQAPNLHYMTGGAATVPIVVRTRVGDGPYGGHPQDYAAWFAHVPGLRVVMPATPADARGLMCAALREPNPVLFFEPMSLAHGPRGDVPVGEHRVPIGSASIARPGRDITLVAIGSMVPPALRAAAQVEPEGLDVEVLDLRSLAPWDEAAVLASVRRTGRLAIVHEAWLRGGIGAEIAATVAERGLDDLMAPIERVGAAAVPIPSGPLRAHALPDVAAIVRAIRRVADRPAT